MALSDKNLVSLVAAEHIGPTETGDNIDAKRVALYYWDGSNWQRYGVALENLTDQLAHLINRLNFLSSIQTINGELKIAPGATNWTSTTLGAVTTVGGQTNMGGFGAQHTIMSQMNTYVATALRSNILT